MMPTHNWNSRVCMMLAIVLGSYIETASTTSTRSSIESTTPKVEPKTTMTTNQTAMAPNPTAVAPNPTAVAPNPTAVAPNPTAMALNPTAVAPNTTAMAPNTTTTTVTPAKTVTIITAAATTPERPIVLTINPPTTPINHCASQHCKHGANCTSGLTTFSCACTPGYEGVDCSAEINFCAESYACFDGTSVFGDCVDFFNGYNCTCYPGFTSVDARNCTDIDECLSNPCQNNGRCTNELNRFKCDCPGDKIGINCDQDKPGPTPKFTTISKTVGLLAGAAKLVLTGVNLAIVNTSVAGANFIPYNKTLHPLYAYSNVSECDANKITILSPRAPSDDYAGEKFNIQVEYDGGYLINTPFDYTYIGNPSVYHINLEYPIATGGVLLTVAGDNIGAVSEPIMIVTLIITNTNDPGPPDKIIYYQKCSRKDASHLTCPFPVIAFPKKFTNPSNDTGTNQRRRRDLQQFSPERNQYNTLETGEDHIPFSRVWRMLDFDQGNRSHKSRRQRSPTAELNSDDPDVRMALFLGFRFDGYSKYDNISKTLPNVKMTLTLTKPEFVPLPKDKVQTIAAGETLEILGTNLSTGCTKDDYLITIGVGICEIRTNISDNLIECYPPTTEPAPGDDIFCDGTLAVLVTVAQQTYFVYCVRYLPVSTIFGIESTKLIVGLCVGLAFVPLIIAVVVIIVCRQLRTRTTTDPDNYKQNIYSDNAIISNNDLEPRYVVMAGATPFSDSALAPSSHQSPGFGPVIRGMPTGSRWMKPNLAMDAGSTKSIGDGIGDESEYATLDLEKMDASYRNPGSSRIQPFGGVKGPLSKRVSYTRPSRFDNQGTTRNDLQHCPPPSNEDRYPVNQSFKNQSYGPELDFDSTNDVSPASTISREKRGFKTNEHGQPIDKDFRLPTKGYLKHLLNQEIPVDLHTHNQ